MQQFGWKSSYPKVGRSSKAASIEALCNNSYWQESGLRFETVMTSAYGRCIQMTFNESLTITYPGETRELGDL